MTTKKLVADLENAKFAVSKRPGRFGCGVDVREVTYNWEGHKRLSGEMIIREQGIDLLSYQSERTEEMEAVAKFYCRRIVREQTPFRAVESYLQQSMNK